MDAWLPAQGQLKQQGPQAIPIAFLSYICTEIVPNQNPGDLNAINFMWG